MSPRGCLPVLYSCLEQDRSCCHRASRFLAR
ncbi:uncharacterized protein PODANS_6_9450 [Podospora anserina S mat+]|uniref:Podospora anserina S mat+ genomic DNA chromosome 6, supercontig 4 n=1 Tax=Podospora anserina (strain S / ATCC MYA-4624 / DSM 980 / FGSC 10383) TaxID=515849 RepID=B2AN77_PODAN|nr:uncharacterized protein PODANS_6_9450 [Podospora anserina S mat+]CAP65442.1 unnamed protein product [Podospora anserina S mat+]CDP31438.1 Putative protein of unknown function [Podospora anserina S mat+]